MFLLVRNRGRIISLQKLYERESLEMVKRCVDHAAIDVEEASPQSSPVDRWE